MLVAICIAGILVSIVMSAVARRDLAKDDRIPLALFTTRGAAFFVPRWLGLVVFPAFLAILPFAFSASPELWLIVASLIVGVLVGQFLAFAAARRDERVPRK